MARIIFMGSPEIAVPSLSALAQEHEIISVVTQPDKPKGRGLQQAAPAVKQAAEELKLPILQPEKIRDPEFLTQLRMLEPDFMVVVAYGKILPAELLRIPQICCVNLHFSLLPKYRGAACVAYALLYGDAETGVTSMVMEEGLDTGPILMQWSEPILPQDTVAVLSSRLASLGALQLVQTLAALEKGTLRPVPQNDEEASYAPKISKQEGHVDWNKPAQEIYNRFRAMTPWPGLYSFWGGKRVVWSKLEPTSIPSDQAPGTMSLGSNAKLYIDGADSKLEVLELKVEGKKQMSAQDFLRGNPNFKPVMLQ